MWSWLGALRVGFVLIGLLMIIASCTNEDGEVEVALLMSFKKSLVSSDPNNFLSDWTSDSASPCSWRGVSCTSSGLVNTLNLTNASLIGTLHLSTLTSLPSLHHLLLHGNSFTLGNFTVSSSCTLETLDLSTNNFSGKFPFIDLLSCPNLTYLNVSRNFIKGSLPSSLANFTQLQVLDLSSNSFTGNIPSRFCSSALENMLLSDNYLSGMVPSELGGCKNLSTINFSFNNLIGQIPLEIWSLPNLSNLVMWANNFTGEIPEGICFDGGNLETLILNNNFISGSIPQSIGNCTNMIWMSLTSNHITGEIPASVGNLNELAILELGNNLLTGQISPELGKCKSLIWLDLSSNKLIGSIPSELANQAGLIVPGSVAGKQFAFIRNMGGTSCRSVGQIVEFQGIRAVRLEGYPMVHSCPLTRIYSGWTVYTFSNNGSMIYLDLSNNLLTGNIPEKIGSMTYFQVLNLGNNRLTGKIPESFGGLKVITVLYLSNNNLQGFIPGSLGQLSLLTDLDVSNNNLTGSIPSGGQLTTFAPSRYANNFGLCGIPLPQCGTRNHSPGSQNPEEKKQGNGAGLISLGFYVSMALGFIIGFWGVVLSLALKHSWRYNYFRLLSNIVDWVYVRAALLKARISFQRRI